MATTSHTIGCVTDGLVGVALETSSSLAVTFSCSVHGLPLVSVINYDMCWVVDSG